MSKGFSREAMIIHKEKAYRVRVHNNVTYLNVFELGSIMEYCWLSFGI